MEKHEFTDDRWKVAARLRGNHIVTADLLMDAELRRIQSEGSGEAERNVAAEGLEYAMRKYHGCVEAAARHFAAYHPGYLRDAIVEAIDDGYVPNIQSVAFAAEVVSPPLPAGENYN